MRGRRPRSVASNPIFIGAVTVLVVVVAVLLAYQANRGLPFVPRHAGEGRHAERRAPRRRQRGPRGRLPHRPGDEDRAGAGQPRGRAADADARQVRRRRSRDDSTIRIRPRSALGLKYVELVRGRSRRRAAPTARRSPRRAGAVGPELDDFFSIFDEPTRKNIERNLDYFGTGARRPRRRRSTARSARCRSCSATCRRSCARCRTPTRAWRGSSHETGDVDARRSRRCRTTLARGLHRHGRHVRGAVARPAGAEGHDRALAGDARRGHPTRCPTRARSSAAWPGISDEVQGTARELRASLPAVNRALAAGTPVLRRTPQFTEDLEGTLRALRDLARVADDRHHARRPDRHDDAR